MSIESINKTSIWKRTLSKEQSNPFIQGNEDNIEVLRSSFRKMRSNVEALVSQIANVFPNLTQHEISHLDALWTAADLICGDRYPLNPLESFVLGGAFLLHDSALCYEAYEGGQDTIRETSFWKDTLASHPDSSTKEAIEEADFSTIRKLHGDQAHKLCERSWIHPATNKEVYLLENTQLRIHLGQIMGEIAASHNWNIERTFSTFDIKNAPNGFPNDWQIDSFKLACILRCADAALIDNTRAPDFLFALIKRKGLSFNHWNGQNKIAPLALDILDTTGEVAQFTSSIPFEEKDFEAWYLIYDAIQVFQQELVSSNALLEKSRRSQFKIKKICGTENTTKMSSFVKTNGWTPCSANIHVSNIEKLINTLGGKSLYGISADELHIALRELIQNSRDAVIARKIVDPFYENPKITIRLNNTDDGVWVIVEDNGIGMSERVLTKTLLDFGNSFWSSDLIKSEFPGLKSSTFKSVGKFGIGFYSVFMLSGNIMVLSKPFGSGKSELNELKFINGLSLRPILKKGENSSFPTNASTQVRVKIDRTYIAEDFNVQIPRKMANVEHLHVNFGDYVSAMCIGLDVNVYYRQLDEAEINIHQDITLPNFDRLNWLKQITFAKYQEKKLSDKLDIISMQLRPVNEKDIRLGLVAIYPDLEMKHLSYGTTDGFATDFNNTSIEKTIIGFMDTVPNSAKRERGENKSTSTDRKAWAEGQTEILLKMNLDPISGMRACCLIYNFGADPFELLKVLVKIDTGYHAISLNQIVELSLSKPIIFAFSKHPFPKKDILTTIDTREIDLSNFNGIEILVIINMAFCNILELDKNLHPKNQFSLYGCIYRAILKRGHSPVIELIENHIMNYKHEFQEVNVSLLKIMSKNPSENVE